MAVSIKLKNKYWDTSSIVHGHTDLKTFLNNLILNKVYPVGAIYISTSSTSPATLFGGTWSRIQGKFLLAANDSAEAYNAGKTGGEVSHTLTWNEMPKHTHSLMSINENSNGYVAPNGRNSPFVLNYNAGIAYSSATKGWNNELAMGEEGGNYSHNNMPPFLAVYVWKRTK